MVEILQLVHEISNFSEVLCERGDLKNFSKFTDKHKKQWFAGVLKNFTKFIEKTSLPQSLF